MFVFPLDPPEVSPDTKLIGPDAVCQRNGYFPDSSKGTWSCGWYHGMFCCRHYPFQINRGQKSFLHIMISVVFSKVLSALLDLANHKANDLVGSRFQNPQRSVSSPVLHEYAVALSGLCFA